MTKEVWSLPNCPSDLNTIWHNCFGTYTLNSGEYRGDKYVGEFRDDEFHGQGTYTYADGEKYIGEWKYGERQGQGTYIWTNGSKYIGEFKDGISNGQGSYYYGEKTEWAGDKYVGEFRDELFYGQGIYTFASGDRYVGEFRDDEFHGQGMYTFVDGEIYIGEFQNNVYNGQGTLNFENGHSYVGEFKNGKYNGQGTLTYADGTIKEGVWKNNEFLYSNKEETLPNCPSDLNAIWHNCFGTFTFNYDEYKGDKYVGEWKDNEFNGQGTYTSADGSKYIGEWKDNEANGYGVETWGDRTEFAGDKYVGQYKDDEFHGQGTYTFSDGESYSGEFKDSNMHGQGTYTYADGNILEGMFENGEFLYATNDSTDNNNNFSNDDEILPASSGSGFAVTSDGHIVTNYHVIEGCQNVDITYKGQTIPATVISFDLNNDLALLKSDFKPLYTFPLSRKNPYALMDIYVAGYPFGYDISTPVKITRGIVSSLAGIGNNFSQVQIDAAIQPGNSGGPIFDNKGNAVGVAVSKLDLEVMMDSYGVVPEGTNFGIKSNVVINFLESNNISLVNTNTKALSAEALGRMIPDGTYYISCWMTLAQIEKMRERKVLFDNLK